MIKGACGDLVLQWRVLQGHVVSAAGRDGEKGIFARVTIENLLNKMHLEYQERINMKMKIGRDYFLGFVTNL